MKGLSRRGFLKKSAGLTSSTLLLPTMLRARMDNKIDKNIVFIISDQHRWDASGCYGNEYIDTPNIDRLASEGTRFNNMYCQFPITVPSRQSLIRANFTSINPTSYEKQKDDIPTLIDDLKYTHGYSCWLAGRSYMSTRAFDVCIDDDKLPDHLPQEIIDAEISAKSEYLSAYEGLEAGFTMGKINALYVPYYLNEKWHREYLFYKVAESILNENSTRPALFWISFTKPHTNWTPPYRLFQKYRDAALPVHKPQTSGTRPDLPRYLQDRRMQEGFNLLTEEDILNATRSYYACTEYMDDVVGYVLDLLEQHDLVDNTILVYTSDHGEMLGDHGLFFKMCFYEHSIRVPFIIKYPGVIPAGRTVDKVTGLIDVLPTIYDYLDLAPAGSETGESMRCIIDNPDLASWKNETLAQFSGGSVMVRRDEWKYNHFPEDQDQLFNLVRDPGETNNILNDLGREDIVKSFRDRIIRFNEPR